MRIHRRELQPEVRDGSAAGPAGTDRGAADVTRDGRGSGARRRENLHRGHDLCGI